VSLVPGPLKDELLDTLKTVVTQVVLTLLGKLASILRKKKKKPPSTPE
jgi:hypothetical protein